MARSLLPSLPTLPKLPKALPTPPPLPGRTKLSSFAGFGQGMFGAARRGRK